MKEDKEDAATIRKAIQACFGIVQKENEEEPQDRVSMIKKWIEAARPRTLPTSVSPVIAASAYAWYQNTFNGYAAAICLIFALLAQLLQISATITSTIKKEAIILIV
ncbi:MAG: hypothetical protein V8R52_02125 [Coprobacter fastidiosus]